MCMMSNYQTIYQTPPSSSATSIASHSPFLMGRMMSSDSGLEFEGENGPISYDDGLSGFMPSSHQSINTFFTNTASIDGSKTEKKPLEKKKGAKKIKREKYAFQTRSQVDILDDGYRWRKYGQKAVKNNKFPRSYYRCTHQGCNVKKQVQRLSKDEGVVVTTYEGVHSHPIEKSTDNFEHILTQMQIYPSF